MAWLKWQPRLVNKSAPLRKTITKRLINLHWGFKTFLETFWPELAKNKRVLSGIGCLFKQHILGIWGVKRLLLSEITNCRISSQKMLIICTIQNLALELISHHSTSLLHNSYDLEHFWFITLLPLELSVMQHIGVRGEGEWDFLSFQKCSYNLGCYFQK